MSRLDVTDLADIDTLLSDDERDVRRVVRSFVQDRIAPKVADWFERAAIEDPRAWPGSWADSGSSACTSMATAARG